MARNQRQKQTFLKRSLEALPISLNSGMLKEKCLKRVLIRLICNYLLIEVWSHSFSYEQTGSFLCPKST